MSARANNIVSSSTESINTRIWYTKYVLTMLLSTYKLESVIWSLGARYLTSIQVPPKCTDSSQNFFPTQSRMYLQVVFDRKLLTVLSQKLSQTKNFYSWMSLNYRIFENWYWPFKGDKYRDDGNGSCKIFCFTLEYYTFQFHIMFRLLTV